ncbi:MAG: hypothetical protein HC881_00910 [Leptolyngbyaceae cyanobacterium SL_7_1]|nr:hypothetical protein [Leptolyngbyaceae cyanobacterium SL_7_1]
MEYEITGIYNPGLVFLSCLIATIAAYTALDLARQVKQAQSTSELWLLGGAIAMGTGIWSMHFIAILALRLPLTIHFNTWMTLLSWIDAVIASAIALWLLGQSPTRQWLGYGMQLGGGVCMGIAIAWMHYTGMAALHLPATLTYDGQRVKLSIAIAMVASLVALVLASRLPTQSQGFSWHQWLSAIVMGGAISGTHYSSMGATHFVATSPTVVSPTSPTMMLNTFWLATTIAMATLCILSLTLLAIGFNRRLTIQQSREQTLKDDVARFRNLVREMRVGVLLLSPETSVLVNNQLAIDLLNLDPALFHQPILSQISQFCSEAGEPIAPEDCPVQQAIAQRQPVHRVLGIDDGTGTHRWLLVDIDPQLTDRGAIEFIVCTFSDITPQNEQSRRSAAVKSGLPWRWMGRATECGTGISKQGRCTCLPVGGRCWRTRRLKSQITCSRFLVLSTPTIGSAYQRCCKPTSVARCSTTKWSIASASKPGNMAGSYRAG